MAFHARKWIASDTNFVARPSAQLCDTKESISSTSLERSYKDSAAPLFSIGRSFFGLGVSLEKV